MVIGEHHEPFFVDCLFERFVLGPYDDFNDVVHRASRCFHDTADICEHQLALALDIRRSFSRFRFHAENSTAHHEWTDDASHRNGIFVMESRDLKTTASAHSTLLIEIECGS